MKMALEALEHHRRDPDVDESMRRPREAEQCCTTFDIVYFGLLAFLLLCMYRVARFLDGRQASGS